MNDTEKTSAVREHEHQTTGADEWFQHPFGMVYTSGIYFMAETCGAHWLLDLVASHQPDIRKKMEAHRLRPFQVWRIRKKGDNWLIDCWSDTPGGNPPDEEESFKLAEQELEYSDFPTGLSGFEFWVEDQTMLLPAEH